MFLALSPSRALLAAMARRGRTTRPKATARFQQLFIRFNAVCQIAVTLISARTVLFFAGFDAELPAVPAPQRVILHPHQLHSSTSRELLAYPW